MTKITWSFSRKARRVLQGACCGVLVSVLGPALADEHQPNETFQEGTVAIYCAVLDKDRVPERVFNAAFPGWVAILQGHANEGRVVRVHYLPEFRGGIFIVVAGEDLAEARVNASLILEAHTDQLEAAWAESETRAPPENNCELIEIGPVAILPR